MVNGDLAGPNLTQEEQSPWSVRRLVCAGVLAGSVLISGCASGNESESRDETTTTTAEASTTTTTLEETLSFGVVGDGSDAAIEADVRAGLTRCGGTGVTSTEAAPFDGGNFMDLLRDPDNRDLAQADEAFWKNKNAMGENGFKFFANNILRNPLTNDDGEIEGMPEYSRFIGGLAAVNPDSLTEDRTVLNHRCVDNDNDGTGDSIAPFDRRMIKRGQTTVTAGILTPEDFQTFKEILESDGGDIENLLHSPITIQGEEFMAVGVKLDACLNNILADRGGVESIEAPVPVTPEEEEEEKPVPVVTTTSTAPTSSTSSTSTTSSTVPRPTTSSTTTTQPAPTTSSTSTTTTSTTASTTTTSTLPTPTTEQPPVTRPEVTVPAPEPIQGPGSGGEQDIDNNPDNNATTSTTAQPATTQPPTTSAPATTAPRPSTTEAPQPAPTAVPTTAPEGESGINPEDLASVDGGLPWLDMLKATGVFSVSVLAEIRRRRQANQSKTS